MSANVIAVKTLLRLVALGPVCYRDLQEQTGMGTDMLTRWLRVFRGQVDKKGQRTGALIYIAEWKKHNNITVPYWEFGVDMRDAPKPLALTQAQHAERRRIKIMAARLTGTYQRAPRMSCKEQHNVQ